MNLDLHASAPPTLLPRVLDAVGLGQRYVVRPSPVGEVAVAWGPEGITACLLVEEVGDRAVADAIAAATGRVAVLDESPDPAFLERVDRGLRGERVRLRYDLSRVGEFGRAVLEKAQEIPAGQVRPYGWIASEIGRPGAVRAVGTALGRNPVPVLIPCHRVVRTDGRIGNYAFGSARKRALLRSEGVDPEALEQLAGRGVRYVASTSTGVFCHPTCAAARRITPARLVELRSAAAADAAGFRPCKLCRPLGTVKAGFGVNN